METLKIGDETLIVDGDTIVSPGRFEGEPTWVARAYDDFMGGGWDYVDIPGENSAYVELDESLNREWGIRDDMGYAYAVLFFSEQGFVEGWLCDEDEFEEEIAFFDCG